jgi:hypothetical protein
MDNFKDSTKVTIISHILIKDKDTNEILVNKSDNKEVKKNDK